MLTTCWRNYKQDKCKRASTPKKLAVSPKKAVVLTAFLLSKSVLPC